jgi:hypothetical protein
MYRKKRELIKLNEKCNYYSRDLPDKIADMYALKLVSKYHPRSSPLSDVHFDLFPVK